MYVKVCRYMTRSQKCMIADGCGNEINKVLLLLLGCAVQGDQREKFIERIKRMQTDLQTAIVKQIQRVYSIPIPILFSSKYNISLYRLEANRYILISLICYNF